MINITGEARPGDGLRLFVFGHEEILDNLGEILYFMSLEKFEWRKLMKENKLHFGAPA
jgi:hypothetical protein